MKYWGKYWAWQALYKHQVNKLLLRCGSGHRAHNFRVFQNLHIVSVDLENSSTVRAPNYLSPPLKYKETGAQRGRGTNLTQIHNWGIHTDTQFSQVFTRGWLHTFRLTIQDYSGLLGEFFCQMPPLSQLSLCLSTEKYSAYPYRFLAKKSKVLLSVVASPSQYCEIHGKIWEHTLRAMTLQFHTFWNEQKAAHEIRQKDNWGPFCYCLYKF